MSCRFFLFLAFGCCAISSAQASITIPLTVNVSEAVTVTGTPRVAVDVGGQTRYATYTAGTGTTALTFTLTPQAGDVDLDGIAVSSPIDLNGGTIKDLAGNNLAALTFTPPNTSGIKVNYPSLGMDFAYDADGRYTLNGTAYNDLPSFLTATGGTFTRASTATYFDSSGTLQTALANTPRFDYDPVTHTPKGLLIEENRTNYLLQSQDFSTAIWSKNGVNVIHPATIAPDGSMTASDIILTGTSSKSVFQIISTPSTDLVFSVWLKAHTATSAAVGLYDSTGSTWGAPSSGSTIQILSGPGSAVPYASGAALWYINGLSTTEWTHVAVRRSTYSNRAYIYPDLSAQSVGDSIYVWGAQVEQGAFPTSYIPTTTAAVTRAADVLTVNNNGWYGTGAGTIFSQALQTVNASTASAAVEMWFDYNNKISCRSQANYHMLGGANQAAISLNLTQGVSHKQAFGYATNDFATYKDGTLAGVDATGSLMSAPSFMRIGNTDGNATLYYNGWISMVKFYPARVSNTQLQLLTQ